MHWKYETLSLKDVHSMMDKKDHIHPDYDMLKQIAKKAYEVAKVFEEEGMNEEFITKYLDDKLPCDALCRFGLVSSVLYPEDVDVQDRIYSCSHKKWLNTLNRTKLHWTWEEAGVELKDTQSQKLKTVLDSYKELHELALSYRTMFND